MAFLGSLFSSMGMGSAGAAATPTSFGGAAATPTSFGGGLLSGMMGAQAGPNSSTSGMFGNMLGQQKPVNPNSWQQYLPQNINSMGMGQSQGGYQSPLMYNIMNGLANQFNINKQANQQSQQNMYGNAAYSPPQSIESTSPNWGAYFNSSYSPQSSSSPSSSYSPFSSSPWSSVLGNNSSGTY